MLGPGVYLLQEMLDRLVFAALRVWGDLQRVWLCVLPGCFAFLHLACNPVERALMCAVAFECSSVTAVSWLQHAAAESATP